MKRTNEKTTPRLLKRGDILLAAALLLFAAALFVVYFALPKDTGTAAKITVNNQTVATLPLSKNTTYTVRTDEGYNIVTVKDGAVSVSEADCKNQICVHSRAVSRAGERIICLPHKLTVVVVGGDTPAMDFVV